MDTPGNVLRTERKNQKKSLREIARTLRINIEYLKAIEDDNYQLLPAEVFTKAYLRLYAVTLNLDGDFILSLYENQIKTFFDKTPASSQKKIIIPLLDKILQAVFNYKPVLIITSLLLIVIPVLIIMQHKEQKDTKKVVNEVNEQEIVRSEKFKKKILEIAATELTWVSVRIDGGKPKEWLLRSGEMIKVTAFEKFVIKIGNAGGTRLTLNNEDIGELGPHGKVVDIILPGNKSS